MIEINAALMGVIISVLASIVGIVYALGAYSQRIKHNEKTIKDNKEEAKAEMEKFCSQNREDHRQIFDQLNALNSYVRNGKSRD